MEIIKRALSSFLYSAFIAMVCLLLVEVISTALGFRVVPMTPEFISYFPSETIALEVDILLYGVFGMVFGGMSFIYEKDKLGFVLQNIIYCLTTAIIWIPIITFIWQLWKYKPAMIYTIVGFIASYVIITVSTYLRTRHDIDEVNRILKDKE